MLCKEKLNLNYKKMKNLNSPRSSRSIIPKSMASIEYNHPLMSKDRQTINCAFHLGEKITNFCKDLNCLLPLCPKCVKIHSEQHAKMGVFSSFHTIDECLEEAHGEFISVFSSVSKLQQISFEVEETYRKKVQQTVRDFANARKRAHQYLQNVLNEYEEALRLQIAKDDRQFSQNLIQYHDYISQAMENCKNGARKLSNKALILEGLINYYSENSYKEGLEECEKKLNEFTSKKITITTKEYQLERFVSIMKRYIMIGDSTNSFENLMTQAKMVKTLNIDHAFDGQSLFASKGIAIKQSRKIQDMKSPLDNYSLERSRNLRLRLEQQ